MSKRKIQKLVGSFILGLGMVWLTACGGTPTYSWPGVTVSGSTAYFAYNQYVAAINIENGQLLWKYPDAADNALLFYSNPLIDSQGRLSVGTYEGAIVQLEAATGKLLWKVDGGKTKIYSPVLETQDSLAVSSEDGLLHFLNPVDGSTRRTINLGHSTWGNMATDGKSIYIATLEHWVYALEAGTGQIIWSFDAGTSVAGGVTLAAGKLLIGTFGGHVVALDAATGKPAWESAADNWVWGAPIVDGGNAYYADLSGVLRAVSLADGKILWSVAVGKPITAQIAFSDGMLYVGSDDGKVRAFAEADGKKQWEVTPIEAEAVHGSLAVAGDRLLVTLTGGATQIVALSRKDGSLLWKFDGVK